MVNARGPIAIVSAWAVGLGLTLGGCVAGTGGPARVASTRAGSPAGSPVAMAETTHEYPSAASRQTAPGSLSAVEAISIFASVYINWNADDVSADMRSLAAASIGQARSAMELVAAQTARDYELRRGGIANRGTVEVVAPLGGHPGQYVVVTREATTASATNAYQGLRPAWHLTIATAARLGSGEWVISGWQPEG